MPNRIVTALGAALLSALVATGADAQGSAGEGAGMESDEARAIALMAGFAERTGFASEAEPRRYLWTDAFALLNLLDLYEETGDEGHRARAAELIEEVHGVLGRHRPDDPREGWLSGLPEAEGARHPTQGGLRIGKPLPERGPNEPFDERLEWDRDGQYFHYLTRWMDALAHAAAVLDEPRYRRHAVELARAVLPRFLRRAPSGEPEGLAWKMSVDLSRPLVAGMSPNDVLDGYVTLRRLGAEGGADLEEEIAVLRGLLADERWGTADPLGLGGLMLDAARLAALPDRTPFEERLAGDILAGADAGLRDYLRRDPLEAPASRRLAFRELGLAIGLGALPAVAAAAERSPGLAQAVAPHLRSLSAQAEVGERIAAYWSDPRRREGAGWRDHRDINEVMLATALLGAHPAAARPRAARPPRERRRATARPGDGQLLCGHCPPRVRSDRVRWASRAGCHAGKGGFTRQLRKASAGERHFQALGGAGAPGGGRGQAAGQREGARRLSAAERRRAVEDTLRRRTDRQLPGWGARGGEVAASPCGETQAMSAAQTTTDHGAIRHWAEERGGRPSRVKDTGEGGLLRIDFGDRDEGLEEISWDEFFEVFEANGLALLHQDETEDGSVSRFNKLVERDAGG